MEQKSGTNRLMQRNNLADAFLLVGDDATEKALAEARAQVGDAEWKKGFSPETKKIVRDTLKAHGVRYEDKLQGKLLDVQTAETQANGEKFQKLRVTLEQDGHKTILSADLNSEFAQRLIAKLDTAANEHAGEVVTIGGFANPTERDGRQFINHVATLKNAEGQEIPATTGHFQAAQEKARAAQEPLLTAGMKDRKVLNSIAESTRETYFKELADSLHGRFVEKGLAPKTADRDHYPALIAGVKDEHDRWYNLTAYASRENPDMLVGTLQRRNPATGEYEKATVEFKQTKGDRLTALAQFENGEKFVAALSASQPTEKGHVKVDYNVFRVEKGDNGKNQFVRINENPGRLRENPDLAKKEQAKEREIIEKTLGVEARMLKPYDGPTRRAPEKTRERGKALAV